MGRHKSSRGAAPKISSATAFATASATKSASQSSVLRSLFSPSEYQLSLFASVIQGLDSQHLRIHDTVTGRLRCEHAIASKATINCLDWGYYGGRHRDQNQQHLKKKRKREEKVNGFGTRENVGDVVVAFGTSESEIHMFSPAEAKVVGTLKGPHVQGVREFKFTDGGGSGDGWSIGGDGKLVQWNLWKGTSSRILTIPIHNATTLYPMNSSLICASHTVYTIDPDSGEQDPPIPASNHPVHTILTSSPGSTRASSFLTAAESDHFIGVFSVDTRKLIGNLVVENEVTSLTFYTGDEIRRDSEANIDVLDSMMRPRQALAAVNRDGLLELFPAPFEFITSNTQKDSTKPGSRPKRMTRKATALIKITRPDQAGTVVPLINASFQGNEIVMAWTEGGVKLMFERIQWRDEKTGNFLVSGTKEIIRGKDGPGVGAVVMNGVKDMGLSHVDESHTVVANGEEVDDEVQMAVAPPEVIDISSGEEESEFGDFDVDRAPEQTSELSKPEDTDIDMADAEAKAVGDDEEEEPGEPSFGDLIRANAPETVDVAATFAEPNVQALTSSGERSLQLPSGVSLSTVLAQSLRTNDATLLETCFTVSDLSMVRTTIERLDSSLATVLLQRLAERLHNRPGRAGSLMVWIQWTLVAHGGYLAGQPAVMKKLASLHRVVKERANSLQSLLSLKGKLDMLEAQMNLRKSMQGRSQNAINGDDDDEDDVIYVEGQEESSSEDESPINTTTSKPTSKHPKPTSLSETIPNNSDTDESSADSASDGMPTTTATNGILTSSSASSNEEEEDLFDDEAEETDDDSGDAEGADEMDDEDDESADSELEVPVPKRMARVGLSNGVGSSSSSSAFKRR